MDEEYIQQPQSILTRDQRVRLFISSTLEELKQERQAVKRAIRSLRLHPVLFEGGARPHPPRKVYRANLADSQVYIGIFWRSYGWIAPRMTVSGIEDEYDLSNGKPRLIYVKDSHDGREPRLDELLERIRNESTACYQKFSTTRELVKFVKNDVALLLSERFGLSTQNPGKTSQSPPNYLTTLQDEIAALGIVRRENSLSEIKGRLEENRTLLIIGDPGIGKTFLLAALGEDINGIYVSLRNKTAQQVCSHLANHLAIRRGQLPQSFPSEGESFDALQQELANNSAVLLIDDVDQNQAVGRSVFGLDFYSCRVVFAARSDRELASLRLAKHRVSAFNREETERFLALHDLALPPGKFRSLYSASQGNPLYLYYFSRYQISPLPRGLEDYQRLLWDQLSPVKQEILNFISFSLELLDVSDLHALLNQEQSVSSTLMETKNLVDSVVPLIRQTQSFYEVFHPHFQEFIRSEITGAGLSSHYHSRLGEYAFSNGWIVPTAFHFLHAKDPRMKEQLMGAAQVASLRGEWPLAEEFLLEEIISAKVDGNQYAEADAHHLLAQVFQELGKHEDARTEADLAMKLYGELGDEEQREMVAIWSSTLLIEQGRAPDSIETLKRALNFYAGKDELKEAFIQLNLSFAYLQISLFREGAEAGQRALELFQRLDHDPGIQSSLLNIAGCLGSLGDRELQREYALKLIQMATSNNLLRLKAAGLNHLAIVQRQKGEYSDAEASLQEGIEISQELGMKDVEVLNIANLGNIYRDQRLYNKAESAYTESLLKSREHKFIRHEARALELLAHLKHDRGLYEAAIHLGTEALTLHKEFGEHLRIASTQDYLARSYVKLGRNADAAASYEDSANHYEIAGILEDAAYGFDQAASIWNSLGTWERAAFCISEGLRVALQGKQPDRARSLLSEVLGNQHVGDYSELYLAVLRLYINESTLPFSSLIRSFAAYCKRRNDANERAYFKMAIATLIDALAEDPSERVLNALAVAIEQASPEILTLVDFERMMERARQVIDHLHYRLLSDGVAVWTTGLDWRQPVVIQVRLTDDDYVSRRLGAALALILRANRQLIEADVCDLGQNNEDGFGLDIITEKTVLETTSIEYGGAAADKETPASFSASRIPWNKPQPPTLMIVDDDYEIVSNWATHPGNRAFVWVLMNVHTSLVAHCIHRHREDVPSLARRSRLFCEAVLK